MSQSLVGIAVNPASGKDIRRLVAKASVFDNQEKTAIVRRAAVGALQSGAQGFRYLADTHGIAETALRDVALDADLRAVTGAKTGSAYDTITGAQALMSSGCAVVVTLGGDGTNRAFVLGWRHAPLIPISTGTNNVFPGMIEATVAGAAAGLIASGAIALGEAARQAKLVVVEIDGDGPDVALVDAVYTTDRFVGARALLDSDRLRMALLTRANPAAVGISSVGGLVAPVDDADDAGLLLEFGAGGSQLRAPIAPGYYQAVDLASSRQVVLGETVVVTGPGVLAFDGERERELRPGQRAELKVVRDGPFVVDVRSAMTQAARNRLYWD